MGVLNKFRDLIGIEEYEDDILTSFGDSLMAALKNK